ncbi:hypothetical protein DAKH74_029890 [Maudiozyma humilis]|uniref:Uncharacterized protein n=1 Tax=Maudiozyma humilis TaxID=51915 RepID=A0AAV5RY60_MAUHU|nr:hypothetical protein DAKH74_029890 [Kazachstania humilis]
MAEMEMLPCERFPRWEQRWAAVLGASRVLRACCGAGVLALAGACALALMGRWDGAVCCGVALYAVVMAGLEVGFPMEGPPERRLGGRGHAVLFREVAARLERREVRPWDGVARRVNGCMYREGVLPSDKFGFWDGASCRGYFERLLRQAGRDGGECASPPAWLLSLWRSVPFLRDICEAETTEERLLRKAVAQHGFARAREAYLEWRRKE